MERYKNMPLPATQQGRAQDFVKKKVSPKGSDPIFLIAIVGATDPINLVNHFFLAFVLQKSETFQKSIKIKLIFPIFPFRGNRMGSSELM